MTQTTLILLNGILGAAVAYGLLWLLASGIGSDRGLRDQQVEQFPQTIHDRIAA